MPLLTKLGMITEKVGEAGGLSRNNCCHLAVVEAIKDFFQSPLLVNCHCDSGFFREGFGPSSIDCDWRALRLRILQ